MPEIYIHQIYYSAETRGALDNGFIALDNMRNERPDWREYWPMRNYLLTTSLNPSAYYGFLSPKFGTKTGLDSVAVLDFVGASAGTPDVILFSPFFDQIAYPLNIFEQGALQHPDTLRIFRECVLAVAPKVAFDSLVMDSSNTVFCNFFVAKSGFWTRWLEVCERIFAIAEARETDLARRLNEDTSHGGAGAPTKVFVIERMASLLLSTEKRWNARAYNPLSLPWSNAPISGFRLEMAFLDSLKIAYASQHHSQYLEAFHSLRQMIGESLQGDSGGSR